MAVLNSSILRSIITFLLGSLASILLQRSFALLPAPGKEEEEEKKEEEEEEKTRQLPDFMVDEYFSRMRSFLGDDNFGSLRNSFVVVVCFARFSRFHAASGGLGRLGWCGKPYGEYLGEEWR